MTDKNRIGKRFQKSQNCYNENAVIQKEMASRLMDLLLMQNNSNSFERILEIGCGTGLLTEKIKEKISFKNYFANDLVSDFESRISQIISPAQFYWGDAENIPLPENLNLIISNAVIQWFDHFENQIRRWENILQRQGILAFTTFGPENYREIKTITHNTLNYLTFNQICQIGQQKFQLLLAEKTTKTLYFKTPLDVIRHIHKTGVNGNSKSGWSKLDYDEFADKYKFFYHQEKGFPLTYEPYYFVFKKD